MKSDSSRTNVHEETEEFKNVSKRKGRHKEKAAASKRKDIFPGIKSVKTGLLPFRQ